MIEEISLLKRLSFKRTDTHFITLWADWRNPERHKTIVELVRIVDSTVIVHKSYDYSNDAINHYARILKEQGVT